MARNSHNFFFFAKLQSTPLPFVSGQDLEVACRVVRRSPTFSKRQLTNRLNVKELSPKPVIEESNLPSRRAIVKSYLEISQRSAVRPSSSYFPNMFPRCPKHEIIRAGPPGMSQSFFQTQSSCYVHARRI